MDLTKQLIDNSSSHSCTTPSVNVHDTIDDNYKLFESSDNTYSNTLQALELSLASEEELPATASWMDISELASKLTEIPISLSPSMLNTDTVENGNNESDMACKSFTEVPLGLSNGLVVPVCTASYIDLQNITKNKAFHATDNTLDLVSQNDICSPDNSLSLALGEVFDKNSKDIDLSNENQQAIIDEIHNIDSFTNVDYDDMFELFTKNLESDADHRPKQSSNVNRCKCSCDSSCCNKKSINTNNTICNELIQTFQDITRDICKCIDCKCDPSQECWANFKEYYSLDSNQENHLKSGDYANIQKDDNLSNINEFNDKCCVVICLKNVDGLKELLFNC